MKEVSPIINDMVMEHTTMEKENSTSEDGRTTSGMVKVSTPLVMVKRKRATTRMVN